jgi:hypothetical protein
LNKEWILDYRFSVISIKNQNHFSRKIMDFEKKFDELPCLLQILLLPVYLIILALMDVIPFLVLGYIQLILLGMAIFLIFVCPMIIASLF